MQPGTTVNQRYEILSEIGRGGMGVVFRGRSIGLDRPVAIKLLNDSPNQETMLRAQREAQALANVKHENLVQVHALETDESGRLMLVFDFIEGRPLSEILQERKLNVDEISSLFKQLCAGLAALHASGFIHRDLKPSNLMITKTASGAMHLTIIDFGLAKSLEKNPGAQKLTSTGAVMGTLAYMSPEQASAQATALATDLYSAAIVLYEMITGTVPFADESPYLVAQAHLCDPVPSIKGKTDQPQNVLALDTFFERALAKAPADRFASAEEMQEAFEAAKTSGTLVRVTAQPTIKSEIKPVPPAIKVTGGVVVIVAGIAAVGWVTAQRPQSPAPVQDKKVIAARVDAEAQKAYNHAKAFVDRPDKDYLLARRDLKSHLAEIEALGEGGRATADMYSNYGRWCISPDVRNRPQDPEEGIKYIQKAMAIRQRMTDRLGTTRELSNLAEAYTCAEKYLKVVETLQEVATSRGGGNDKLRGDEPILFTRALNRLEMFADVIGNYGTDDRVLEPMVQTDVWHTIRRELSYAYIFRGKPATAIAVLEVNQYNETDASLVQNDLLVKTLAYAMDKKPVESRQTREQLEKRGFEWFHRYIGTPEALDALNYANEGDRKKASEALDKLLAISFYDERLNEKQRRDLKFQGLRALPLGEEAAKRIGDKERAAQCRKRADKIKDELIEQGAFAPRSS